MSGPLNFGHLNEEVMQCPRTLRGRCTHGPRQGARACSDLYQHHRGGSPHLDPPSVEGPRHHPTEQRADLRAGDEVPTTPGSATALVEPQARLVETGSDVGVEPDRPGPGDVFGEQSRQGPGGIPAPLGGHR